MLMPDAQRHGFLDGLNIVEVHHQIHLDAVRAEEAVQFAPDAEVLIEPDEIAAVEVRRLEFVAGWPRGAWEAAPRASPRGAMESRDLAARFGIADQSQVGRVVADRLVDFFGPHVFHVQIARWDIARRTPLRRRLISLKTDGVYR